MGVKREIIFIALFLLVLNFSFVSAQTSSDNIFEKIIDFFRDLFIDEPRLSAPASLRVGSVAYYEFNDSFSDGNTVDSSGNGRTATCTVGTSCPGTTTNSLDGTQAASFVGNQNHVFTVADNVALRPSQLSISVLINKPSHDDWDTVITKTTTAAWTDGYGLAYYDNNEGVTNNIYFFVNSYTGGVANALIPNNQWVHVVGTYDGANVRIYVNGVLQETVAYSTPITHSTSTMEIGRGRGSLDPFNGGIDELIIYNRSLSGSEVASLYSSYITTQNLTAIGVNWNEIPGNPNPAVGSTFDWNLLGVSDPSIARNSSGQLSMWMSAGGSQGGPLIGKAVGSNNYTFAFNPDAPVINIQNGSWDKYIETVSLRHNSTVNRWDMWYLGYNNSFSDAGIGQMRSLDSAGTQWTRPAQPIYRPNATSWDSAFISGPSVMIGPDGIWRLYYSGAGTTVGIGLLTSTNGINWTPYSGNPVFQRNLSGWDQGILEPSVRYINGQYVMWYSGYLEPLNDTSSISIGVAYSNDGINWQRYSGNPVISPGATNSWNGLRVVSPDVLVDNNTLILAAYGMNLSDLGISNGKIGLWSSNYTPLATQTCGNNIREGTEVCDGSDLNSQSCTTQGFTGGILSCNAGCSAFVTTSCTSGGICGNGIVEGSEQCEPGGNYYGNLLMPTSSSIVDTTTPTATVCVSAGPGCNYTSIQTGINTVSAGSVLLVKAGTYTVTTAINVNKALTLSGETGTLLRASSPGSTDGILVSANNVVIQRLTLENFSTGITGMNSATTNTKILNNVIRRSQFSVWANGDRWLVEGNEFIRPIWWAGTGDSDYSRMFGTNHIFRYNYLHGANFTNGDLNPASGNDCSHADGIQFYASNGEIFRNITIEKNYFTDIFQGMFISDEQNNQNIWNVTVRDNVFWGTTFIPNATCVNYNGFSSWGTLFGKNAGGTNITVVNNLYYQAGINGGSIGFRSLMTGTARKNIITNNSQHSYILEGNQLSNVNIGDNIRYGANSNWSFSDIIQNPQFTNVNNPLGADGKPLTADDGWRPMNSNASTYGPQVSLAAANLSGQSCTTLGFSGGTLSCSGSCTFNTTQCTSPPQTCGNNIREGTEVCDGSDLNSQSCTTQGFTGGILSCNAGCSAFVTTSCTSGSGTTDCSSGNCRYLASVASGTGNASDWNNVAAFSSTSFTRGLTYFLADGTYGGRTYNTPTSGSQYITLKKATASDHGTNIGWVSTLGDGNATFTGTQSFTTNYWRFDGQTGGGPASWKSGYGFFIQTDRNSNGIDTSATISNIEILHTEVTQTGNTIEVGPSYGNAFQNTNIANNMKFSYVYFHRLKGLPFFMRGGNNTIIEYSYVEDPCGMSEADAVWHCEHLVVNSGYDFMTVRWSIWRNIRSTGAFAHNEGGGDPASDWFIYGNIFSNLQSGSFFSGAAEPADTTRRIRLFNNVFDDNVGGILLTNSGDNLFYNNVFHDTFGSPVRDSSNNEVITHDYNYFAQISSNNCDMFAAPNENLNNNYPSLGCDTVIASSPQNIFVSPASENFNLISPITGWPGRNVCTLPGMTCNSEYPLNVDMYGNIRGADGVWDRGAIEFVSGGNVTPSCDLTSSSWSQSSVVEGTQVGMNVIASNCAGQNFNYTIYEDDALVDDAVYSFLSTSLNPNWNSFWVNDGVGDPEYYFRTFVVSNTSEIITSSNPLLSVSQAPTQTCGNNIREGTEVCDGSDLNSQSCTTQGFTGGTLSCNAGCSAFVTSSCTSGGGQTCGDGIVNGTEQCDLGTASNFGFGNLPSTDSSGAQVIVTPGQTIQSGITTATAGQTILVQAGNYVGPVNVNKAVRLIAEPGTNVTCTTSVACFQVSANNILIEGFNIDTGYRGIAVAPNLDSARNNITLRKNYITNVQTGIWGYGNNWTVEGNEINRVRRWSSGDDADYTRFFGDTIVIRYNYMHGTQIPTDLAPGPDYAHTDAIQFYDSNGETFRNVLIEGNYITDIVQGFFIADEPLNGYNPTSITNLTIRNNVIWGTHFTPAGANLLGSPSHCIYLGKIDPLNGPINIHNNLLRTCLNTMTLDGLGNQQANISRNIFMNSVNELYHFSDFNGATSTTFVTFGNMLYNYSSLGIAMPGADTQTNPQLTNVNNPLGNDGIPFTADDGWRPTNPTVVNGNYGPQLTSSGGNSNSSTCTTSCTFTICGDGVIQSPNGNSQNEQCDDSNTANGDGCSATCQIESIPTTLTFSNIVPANSATLSSPVDFTTRINGSSNLQNASLYGNWSGTMTLIRTLNLINTTYGSEILTNGNFEGTYTGGIANGWTIQNDGTIVYTTSSDTGFSGLAQRINVTSAGTWGLMYYRNPAMSVGRNYTWTFKYRSTAGMTLNAGLANVDFSQVEISQGLPSTNGAWQTVQINFTRTNSAADRLRVDTSSVGTFWLDDWSLVERNTTSSRLANVTFNEVVPSGTYSWFITSSDVNGFTNQTTTRTLTIPGGGGNQPVIFKSSMNISNIILSPGPSNSNVSLKLEISDSNGFTNINDSSIIVNFTRAGEITRNGTCTRIVSESSGNFANYSCVGMMQWYDGPGNWTVNTFVRDVNSNSGVNSTGTFVVLANTGISIGISSITFPTLTPGATNQQSNNDPLIISNIGNVNPASLTILARNLTGQIDSSRVIPASLFGTGLTSGNECNLLASDTRQLGNGGNYVTLSNLPGFSLPRGDYISNNALRENFYICLTQVPSNLTSQTYSASGGNAWDIQVS